MSLDPWLVIIGAVVAFGVREAWHVHLGLASRTWPSTHGTLDRAWTRRDEDDGDVDYSAHAQFNYTVKGRTYRGNRLSYRMARGMSLDEALALIGEVPDDDAVPVYYDPRQPARAVLVTGSAVENVVALAGTMVLVAALVFWRWA